ncbi:MAG: SMP-30/gluconolactonase/LRE family protein [Puniceicoccales bacterium]
MKNYDCHFEMIATGIPAAEGPVVDLDGRIFLVSSNAGTILRIADGHPPAIHVRTGGIPAGLQVDRENRLWCADMKLGILCIEPSGELHRAVSTFEGEPIRGCNDLYFDSQGNLYFTAPAGSNVQTPVGEVYCRLKDGTVVRIDDGYRFSNGLAVSADDQQLIVAETFTQTLWSYDLSSPGRAGPRRPWATLPQGAVGPDGMDFDAGGNLLVAHVGASAIEVYSSNGNPLGRIPTPFARPSNLHFEKPESHNMLITDMTNGSLWRTRWERPGQPQYCFTHPQ